MIRPIKVTHKGEKVALACVHWRNFPPATAGGDLLTMKQNGELDDVLEQRHRIWERVCGLTRMEEKQCLECDLVRLIEHVNPHQPPELVTLDGVKRTPAVDIPSITGRGRFRGNLIQMVRKPGQRHSTKNAAWLDAVLEAEKEAEKEAKKEGASD